MVHTHAHLLVDHLFFFLSLGDATGSSLGMLFSIGTFLVLLPNDAFGYDWEY
jgi:hypothetical protein